jgi:hypothetical protein
MPPALGDIVGDDRSRKPKEKNVAKRFKTVTKKELTVARASENVRRATAKRNAAIRALEAADVEYGKSLTDFTKATNMSLSATFAIAAPRASTAAK